MSNKKISELTTASTPDGSELVEIIQGGINKKLTTQEIADLATPGGGGTWGSITGTLSSQTDLQSALDDKQATLTAANFGDFMVALTAKSTPIDADSITISDSASSADAKEVTLTEFKAFLKTYFDSLYVGVEDLFIPATAMWQRLTGGCGPLTRYEMATSLFNVQGLPFDQTTQEFAQFQITLPRKWNNGTITVVPYWTATTGSGTVQWGISGGAYSNDDALTVAFGTAQTSDDTLIATNDLHIGPATSAITLAGSPADADFIGLQISRNPASDTLSGDAILLGISVRLTTDAGIDA